MARSKQLRRGGRSINQFQSHERLASLGLALHRTLSIMHATQQLEPNPEGWDIQYAALTMTLHEVSTWTYLGDVSLSLAYCTIDTWRIHEFSDPVVDQLLTDQEKVAELRDVRDALAHPSNYRDNRLARDAAVYERCNEFAHEVMFAIRAFYRRQIAALPRAPVALSPGTDAEQGS